jgi:hypothetical protein
MSSTQLPGDDAPPLENSRFDANVARAADTPLTKLDDKQQHILASLKMKIHEDANIDDTQKEWCDAPCLCRYLRARQWDLAKAELMLRNSLRWRKENSIDNLRHTVVLSQIVRGHMFNYGYDKVGRPIVLLKVHKEADPHTNEQKLLFMIYCMERTLRLMDSTRGIEKMVWIVSCADYNLKHNGDMGMARLLISTLADHFPERLGLVIVVDPPLLFRGLWKVVSPFVDDVTKRKLLFVSGSDKEKRKLMEEYVDVTRLPKELFYGDSDYKFDANAYVDTLRKEEAALD